MYIVIIGCGTLGSGLASGLSCDGHEVVIIDNIEDNLARLESDFNGRAINCAKIDNFTLVKAGIDKADMFLAVTPDDNMNIMMSQIAKNIHGVKTVIAVNVDPSRESIYRKLGIEYINEAKLALNAVKNKVGREMV